MITSTPLSLPFFPTLFFSATRIEWILADYGINRNYLLGVLGCGIVLGLFFYLKFFFFLAVVLLILGANLDQQIAEYIDENGPVFGMCVGMLLRSR